MTEPLSIYIHWPWCQSKCPYCDFNSHVADEIDQERWRAALITELEHFAAEVAGRTVKSVFFGGGTPSLMAPRTVRAIINFINLRMTLAEDAEVTLEANPTSSEAGKFEELRDAGINRLSLGVQSFDDAALHFLGRAHDSKQAEAAITAASRIFPRFSVDLIYARPEQSVTAWRAELDRALSFSPGHLSAYQLTIEPGTRFYADGVPAAAEDPAVDMFEITQETLDSAGLPAYEVSNHARPGEECRHNLAVWQCGDYIGAGPGAHGRLTGELGCESTRQIKDPSRWLAQIEERGHGTQARFAISPRERAEELIILGLRTSIGINKARLAAKSGLKPEDIVDTGALADLIEDGFLETDDQSVRTTAAGRLCLNAVIGKLLT
jgi:putative oxygen-independent coproporphyrinogen III oxidase